MAPAGFWGTLLFFIWVIVCPLSGASSTTELWRFQGGADEYLIAARFLDLFAPFVPPEARFSPADLASAPTLTRFQIHQTTSGRSAPIFSDAPGQPSSLFFPLAALGLPGGITFEFPRAASSPSFLEGRTLLTPLNPFALFSQENLVASGLLEVPDRVFGVVLPTALFQPVVQSAEKSLFTHLDPLLERILGGLGNFRTLLGQGTACHFFVSLAEGTQGPVFGLQLAHSIETEEARKLFENWEKILAIENIHFSEYAGGLQIRKAGIPQFDEAEVAYHQGAGSLFILSDAAALQQILKSRRSTTLPILFADFGNLERLNEFCQRRYNPLEWKKKEKGTPLPRYPFKRASLFFHFPGSELRWTLEK